MPSFDFEESMSQSFRSAADSIGHSRVEAARAVEGGSLILHTGAKQSGNALLEKIVFKAYGNGMFDLTLTNEDAPADARIIDSILKEAGAPFTQRASADGSTQRKVTFSVSSELQEQLAKNFNGIAEGLARQTDVMTRIIIASNALDRLSTSETGSKFHIVVSLPPEAHMQTTGSMIRLSEKFDIGFCTNVQTNDPTLITKLLQAGFTSSPTSFQLSNMMSIPNGQRFMFTPEQLEPALKIIMDFVRERDEAVPKLPQPPAKLYVNPDLKGYIEQRPDPKNRTPREDIPIT